MQKLEEGKGGEDEAFQNQHLGVMRVAKTKNYNPAEIQVTAEQLIRESHAYRMEEAPPQNQRIMDKEELDDYKYRMRKDFEDAIRRQKHHMGNWIKYGEWEASIAEIQRSRSVFERALEVDFQHLTLWLKYAEMEMKNKFVNHARNIWERACKHLPRVDQFWYKYTYMEELLGNFDKVREIFEDWMTWEPNENAWDAYVKFEERMGEIERCRSILSRYIDINLTVHSYLKAAKFEERLKNRQQARLIYEKALAELGKLAFDENFFIQFTKFEIQNKEIERAKILYKYALDNIPKEKSQKLYNKYLDFEKQHGNLEDMEEAIITKRRHFLESELQNEAFNYDLWFDYTRLEEQAGNVERTREIYERAIKIVPPTLIKAHWKRYIYLWLNYALFEEQVGNDPAKAYQIYDNALQLIPHQTFTFSKIWIMAAHFLLRQQKVDQMRKVLGKAMGVCPRIKIFEAYSNIEFQLRQFDRCRVIYQKQVEIFPDNSNAWIQYADFEAQLEEHEIVRTIYEMAIARVTLDMPENVWKSFIDFEIEQGMQENARVLYQRLLEKTKHVKVWVSFGKFEEETCNDFQKARQLYEDSYDYYKQNQVELKEERLLILENWLKMEQRMRLSGDMEAKVEYVESKLPKRVKKRRKVTVVNEQTGEGANQDADWEEYYDLLFPDDEEKKRNLKILEMARKWKQQSKE